MKKFIIGAVAAVAMLVGSAASSNAQYPVARGIRAAARGAYRVAAPGPVYGPRVVVGGPVYPVYRAPVVAAPRYSYYGGGPYYSGYGGYGYGGYGGGYYGEYGWGPGVNVGVGRVGVRVGF